MFFWAVIKRAAGIENYVEVRRKMREMWVQCGIYEVIFKSEKRKFNGENITRAMI